MKELRIRRLYHQSQITRQYPESYLSDIINIYSSRWKLFSSEIEKTEERIIIVSGALGKEPLYFENFQGFLWMILPRAAAGNFRKHI